MNIKYEIDRNYIATFMNEFSIRVIEKILTNMKSQEQLQYTIGKLKNG